MICPSVLLYADPDDPVDITAVVKQHILPGDVCQITISGRENLRDIGRPVSWISLHGTVQFAGKTATWVRLTEDELLFARDTFSQDVEVGLGRRTLSPEELAARQRHVEHFREKHQRECELWEQRNLEELQGMSQRDRELERQKCPDRWEAEARARLQRAQWTLELLQQDRQERLEDRPVRGQLRKPAVVTVPVDASEGRKRR